MCGETVSECRRQARPPGHVLHDPSTDGTYISIEDEEAKEFRKTVVEWQMTNHPHDCPVCEEGGSCHLQDMTVMMTTTAVATASPNAPTRIRIWALHQPRDEPLHRLLSLRPLLQGLRRRRGSGVYGAHDNVYFGRVEDGTLESEFSGNLVEVCPTGVFTDKTHLSATTASGTCSSPQHLPRVLGWLQHQPGERYGELRRIENRYHGALNHYFLCDRGRFGYGHVNLTDRPRQPLLQDGSDKLAITVDGALNRAADALRTAAGVIGIGSPARRLRATSPCANWWVPPTSTAASSKANGNACRRCCRSCSTAAYAPQPA